MIMSRYMMINHSLVQKKSKIGISLTKFLLSKPAPEGKITITWSLLATIEKEYLSNVWHV